ncbi:MAG: hypothetical protein J6J64_01890 [Alistipes sp.]|nr:hypothetical protein [Alistipes sp.]
MRKFRWMMMLMMATMLSAVSCTETPDEPKKPDTPDTPDTPTELTFDVEISEVTKTTMTFNVTPSDLEAEYFCFVYDKVSADDFTKDQYLVSAIYQEITEEASNKGMTFAEYMPTLLDKGVIEGGCFEGLAAETDYYLIIFGVDAENNFKADANLVKIEFTTLSVSMTECTFDVTVNVDGNAVEFVVVPSDKDAYWHLISVEEAMYNYYVNDPEGYMMSDEAFYLTYFNNEIEQYRGMGYTDEQIMTLIIPKGDQVLGAKGLTANTKYVYLIAGLTIDADGAYVTTPIYMGDYTTGAPAQTDLTFDISVTDITDTRAAILITPSKNNETYCWMIGHWDGVQTAQEIMDGIVAAYGSWMNSGMMLYSGVQDYTGGPGSPYKYTLDAPDTDYYVIAFGYAGGITSEPEMVTFHSAPAPDPSTVEFNMTATNISPYSADVNVSVSSESVYYSASMMDPALWDEATLIEEFNAGFDEMFAMQQMFDPNVTVAQMLATYYFRGNRQLQATGLLPETTVMGYIVVLDSKTGHVARVLTYPDLATTKKLGNLTPTVELVGYYSGDEENGSVFGQPAATRGKAITVVKYDNLEGARSLFTYSLEGDAANSVGYPDTEIWRLCYGAWNSCKLTSPYTFYVATWNEDLTALAYVIDNDGLMGGFGRALTRATAEEKGKIEDLKALVDELNAAEKSSLAMPKSLVVNEEPVAAPAAHVAVREQAVEAAAEVAPYTVMQLDYVRPFYLRK